MLTNEAGAGDMAVGGEIFLPFYATPPPLAARKPLLNRGKNRKWQGCERRARRGSQRKIGEAGDRNDSTVRVPASDRASSALRFFQNEVTLLR